MIEIIFAKEKIIVSDNSTVLDLRVLYSNSRFIYKGLVLKDDYVFKLPKYKLTKITTSERSIERVNGQDLSYANSQRNYAAYRVNTHYVNSEPHYTMEFQALQEFADHQLAENLLKKIANDIGIKGIMSSRKLNVQKLIELHPNQRDILGYNENKGGLIALRLRTDDLTGFRHFNSIITVMLHELSHNVHSGHGDDFIALDRQLNKEWNNYRGKILTTDKVGSFSTPIGPSEHKLGGRIMNGETRDILHNAAIKR